MVGFTVRKSGFLIVGSQYFGCGLYVLTGSGGAFMTGADIATVTKTASYTYSVTPKGDVSGLEVYWQFTI